MRQKHKKSRLEKYKKIESQLSLETVQRQILTN
jgi:hypothetical protein